MLKNIDFNALFEHIIDIILKRRRILNNLRMRDSYWDVVKGIGILSIVLGHASLFTLEVHWYQIPIFFLVAGYLFKEDAVNNYENYFMKKIKSIWIPFCVYNMLFILMHNVFLYIGMYSLDNNTMFMTHYFNRYELVQQIVAVLLGGNLAILCGPTWFIAYFMTGMLLFGLLVYVSRKFFYNEYQIILFILVILCTILGFNLINKGMTLGLNSQIAMQLMIVMYAGMVMRKYDVLRSKFIYYSGIVSIFIIYYAESENIFCRIIFGEFPNWALGLFISFAAMHILLIFAKLICKIKVVESVISSIGRESYHIMALHLLGFKFFSLFLIMIGVVDYSILADFLYTKQEWLKYVYVLFSVMFSIFVIKLWRKIINRYFNKIG